MEQIKVHNQQGTAAEGISLAEVSLNRKKLHTNAFANCIKALMLSWRQGTVACKGRSDVSFSNRKPWRQKGTGRARAGTIRSPLWRKGGIIFGPQKRVRTTTVSVAQRTSVFNNLLFQALDNNAVKAFEFTVATAPSTKQAASMLKSAGLYGSKVVLFLSHDDALNFASFRNIPQLRILFYDQPNAFDLAHADHWVFLKQDVELFKQMVAQWN